MTPAASPIRRRASVDIPDWWRNHHNLYELWEWLDFRGQVTALDIGTFLEKPWKWDPEYQEMRHWQAQESDLA